LPSFPSDMEIVCHEYCRKEMLAMTLPSPTWEKRAGWAEGGEPRKVVPPTTTIDDKITYYYNGIEVHVITNAPAHTFGDMMIYLPEHKVLFAGDIAFHWVAPFCHNAHPTKWMDAVDKILALDVNVIVPGHGPIGGKKEIADMANYIAVFKTEARKRYEDGLTPGKAAASISLGRYDAWIGARDRLVMNTVRFYHEFKGDLMPEYDVEGTRLATMEFNAIKGIKN
jgi:glyoxylase-like metal-dependent hydrolase (beta-lactamase superfamily II)